MNRRGRWGTVGAALLGLALAGCNRSRGTEPAAAAVVELDPSAVAVVRVEELRVGPTLTGALAAAREARLLAETNGTVLAVYADVGTRVRPGQLLARLESGTLAAGEEAAAAAVAAARVAVANAQRNVERTEALVRAGALAPRDLEAARQALQAAESQRAAAEAQLAQARRQVSRTQVRSPIAGIVAQRQVSPGDVVGPGALLFVVLDPTSLRLEGAVPATALPSLRVGAPVEITVQGYPGVRFRGRVTRIAPAVDPATRQVPIVVELANPEGRLAAGLFAEGRVLTQARSAPVIPLAAVDESGGTPSVLRVRGGRTERVTVTLGVRDDATERVEVVRGLAPGDTVLVGEAAALAPGTPVRVRRSGG